jgi:hypothetical protein
VGLREAFFSLGLLSPRTGCLSPRFQDLDFIIIIRRADVLDSTYFILLPDV